MKTGARGSPPRTNCARNSHGHGRGARHPTDLCCRFGSCTRFRPCASFEPSQARPRSDSSLGVRALPTAGIPELPNHRGGGGRVLLHRHMDEPVEDDYCVGRIVNRRAIGGRPTPGHAAVFGCRCGCGLRMRMRLRLWFRLPPSGGPCGRPEDPRCSPPARSRGSPRGAALPPRRGLVAPACCSLRLELTGELSGDRRFARWAKPLRDRRVTSVHDFFEFPSAYGSQDLANEKPPPVAEKWGFRMKLDLETFSSLFRKFADA